MNAFLQQNLEHILMGLIFVSRLGDIGTTYLATPTLKLESNPLIRTFRWPMAVLSFGLCALPYFSVQAAIVVIVMSLLIAFANSTRLWVIRALGEEEYYAIMVTATQRAKVTETLLLLVLPGLFMVMLGALVVMMYPNSDKDFAYYVGLGIFMYALVFLVYHPKNFFRLRKLGGLTAVSTAQRQEYEDNQNKAEIPVILEQKQ